MNKISQERSQKQKKALPTGTQIAEMPILDLLAGIYKGNLGEPIELHGQPKKGKKVIGTLTSPVARHFYTAGHVLSEHNIAALKEHLKLHESNEEGDHDCHAFHKKMGRWQSRSEILATLFLKAVTDELPIVILNEVVFEEGWAVVLRNDELDEDISKLPQTPFLAEFNSRLSKILNGEYLHIDEGGLSPIERGEEVIGSLVDERLKALYTFRKTLGDDLLTLFPEGYLEKKSETMRSLTLHEHKRFACFSSYYLDLTNTLQSVFWLALKEAMPEETRGVSLMTLRQGWDIVSCPPPEPSLDDVVGMEVYELGPQGLQKLGSSGSVLEMLLDGRARR